jgi:hypothetical protein
MAKVIAPFKISGTLDDLNFINSQEGNFVRMKKERHLTSEEFKENPIFDRIRQQGKEMGYCALKSRQFRALAKLFFDKSKEGSFAGRANKILLEILEEDTINPKGERTLEEGMKSPFLSEILIGFEGNKYRPLQKIFKTKFHHIPEDRKLIIKDFKAKENLDWPEEATHVHLSIATANWDYENQTFDTCYSEDIILDKESELNTLTLTTDKPKGNNLMLTYFYVGYAKQERRKHKLLHRKFNTVSIIACHNP